MAGRRLELSTTTTADVGFIIIIAVALFGIRGKAEYDKGFEYRCNLTRFNPVRDRVMYQAVLTFTYLVADRTTYVDQPGNRDGLIAYGSGERWIYTWVHCGSYIACPDCLQAAASIAKESFTHSYGVDVINNDCEIRYETYQF